MDESVSQKRAQPQNKGSKIYWPTYLERQILIPSETGKWLTKSLEKCWSNEYLESTSNKILPMANFQCNEFVSTLNSELFWSISGFYVSVKSTKRYLGPDEFKYFWGTL